jgi:23S rRNA (cytosine1962-C5)-methyltransferase
MDTQTLIIPAAKIRRAAEKRRTIRENQTDALRIFDGSGDGLNGLLIDDFGGRWLVQTFDKCTPAPDPGLGFRSLYWKSLLKTNTLAPIHLAGEPLHAPFLVRESGLRFEIDFQAGLSPGLFLDQRSNRLKLRSLAREKTVLNTFAYTCAFGVTAAVGGAVTANLDLSRHYLEWGKRNYAYNDIQIGEHQFIHGEVFEWLRRFQRRGRKFDIIILDPPTFSRDRKSKIFRVRDDYGDLVALAAKCLNRDGMLFCSTNFRAISLGDFLRILTHAIEKPVKTVPGSMPPDFTGEKYLRTVWMQF